MKDHMFAEPEDFLEDASFRRWVYEARPEDALFWINWLHLHPDRKEEVEQARQFLLDIRGTQADLPEDHVNSRVTRLVERARQSGATPDARESEGRPLWPTLLRLAASVLLLIGLGWWGYRISPFPEAPRSAYEQLVERAGLPLQQAVNADEQPRRITLADGTTVTLGPNSSLSYPSEFTGPERVVYLRGEAFFEVTKNPDAPFLVYANELVTKVLGTSFTVMADEEQKDVTVVVHSGKVSVFANSEKPVSQQKNNRELTEIILLPNQQAVLLREEMRLVRSLVDEPAVVVAPKHSRLFEFKRTPVAEVFATLEKAYEVRIVFDEEVMADCTLTASLSEEPLYEKLRMICASTGSSYQVVDGQVVITGKGCN